MQTTLSCGSSLTPVPHITQHRAIQVRPSVTADREKVQEEIVETISCATFWNNYKDHLSDPDFRKKEIAVNKLMEPLGFDIIFAVEHHFSNYSMGPDHFQFLGYMAAITNRIKLGTLG
jgi:hypothetical protein